MSKDTKNVIGAVILTAIFVSMGWAFYAYAIVPENAQTGFYWHLRRDYEFTPKRPDVIDVKVWDQEYSAEGPPKPNVKGLFGGRVRR